MAITVVHLSDIHVRDEDDVVLTRAALIGNAVRSRLLDADTVLCILSGDIAHSGKAEQYGLFTQFLTTLEQAIGVPLLIAVAPGNHDLDFDLDNKARDVLIKTTIQDSPEEVDESITEIAIVPQRAFFAFRDSVASTAMKPQGTALSYTYSFTIDGVRTEVRCINSAWMSSKKEVPGTLFMPKSTVGAERKDALVFTVFHHPYNWLTPASKPTLRAIESVSDVILTGHEHESDRAVLLRPDTAVTTVYFEAAALQCESGESEFNILRIDPRNRRYQFYHFTWNGTLYEAKDIVAEWEALPLQSSRLSSRLVTTPAFTEWLDDSGIPWAPSDQRRRKRSDIFVYPDLMESFRDPSLKSERRTVPGNKVFETIKSQGITFISGPAKSGRTTLARSLFIDFLAEGLMPLYLDASASGMRAQNSLPATVERQARDQYGEASAEAYMQLPRERRVLILDNAERLRGRDSDAVAFVNVFSRFAANVVILGDNSLGALARLSPEAVVTSGESESFEIQALNFAARERLAEKWFDRSEIDDFEYSRQLEHATSVLDTITGRSYIPAFPIYVIAVLKAVEDGWEVEPKATTHGYFYDLLIRQALTAGSASWDISVYWAFLTHLAYDMYQADRQEFLEDEIKESFSRYDQKILMAGLQYDALIDELCQRGMLLRDGGVTRFRYSYIYNFFVAKHLADTVGEKDTRNRIKYLTKNLVEEQSSDILMFLAHLSQDTFVVESLLGTANGYFSSFEVETLETIQHEEHDVQLEYVERPQLEARRALAANKDAQALKSTGQKSAPDGEFAEVRNEVTAAFHAIRVMGQVLKNFPGALPGTAKVEITDASADLGFRLLNVILSYIDRGSSDVVERAIASIRTLHPGIPEERLRKLAQRYVTVLRMIVSYGIIKTVTAAVAAPQLDRIYKLVFAGEISAAKRLLRISLSIETEKKFPAGAVVRAYGDLRKSPFAQLLLKLFVLDYFNRLWVVPSEKQSVCSKLGIGYKVVAIHKRERGALATSRKALRGD